MATNISWKVPPFSTWNNYILQNNYYLHLQGRSQYLKAVPQNFMEVFNVDDVTTNEVTLKKQLLLREENLQISHSNHYCLISIFSIKLLRKTQNLVFISKGIASQFQYFLDWNLYDDFTVRSSN